MPFSWRENGANGTRFGVSLQEILDPKRGGNVRWGTGAGDGAGARWGSVVEPDATEGACAVLDSRQYNKDDKHCQVRIKQVHVLKKLLDAHIASQQYAVDLLALLERSGD